MPIRFTRTTLAIALATALQPVLAAPAEDEATIVVTATRIAETAPRVPANISVITRKDIDASPAATLPDLLQAQAGINVRTLYGAMATDATVDLRGFGDSAISNTLILLDGQRLNPIDSSGIEWSSLPIESISRIEILHGSGTVLYGDRASGGVINIITDKSDRALANAAVTLGGHGYHAADAHVAGGAGAGYFNLSGHYAKTDGWRDNSQADQQSLAGRVGRRFAGGEVFLDFAGYADSSGTPGALFSNQYQTQPQMSRTPLDYQERSGYRLRPGIALALSADIRLEAELSDASSKYHGRNFGASGSPSYRSDRSSDMLAATPRLRWNHGLGALRSETVLGLDHYDGSVTNPSWSSYSGANTQRAAQQSTAFYFQNITALSGGLDLTLGARHQRVRQEAEDIGAAMHSAATRSRNAWEFGLTAHATESFRLFGKLGHTFRFPNTDELFGFDPITYVTIFNGDLRPQRGDTREIGATWSTTSARVQAALFQMELTDEIAYDGGSSSNVNLPTTRRQGLELDAQWQIARDWRTRLAATAIDATFRGGANNGDAIPLVPRNKISLDATWLGGAAGTWSVLVNHVGSQRFSGDANNTLAMMQSYTTVDMRASWNLRPWTITARVANLLDRRYASFAGYSTSRSDYYYYPAEPRSVFLTARYDFR